MEAATLWVRPIWWVVGDHTRVGLAFCGRNFWSYCRVGVHGSPRGSVQGQGLVDEITAVLRPGADTAPRHTLWVRVGPGASMGLACSQPPCRV